MTVNSVPTGRGQQEVAASAVTSPSSRTWSARTIAIRCARTGALIYVGMVALVMVKADRLVFPAPRSDPNPLVEGARQLDLTASDGVPVHALVFNSPSPDSPVVVQFHGNGEVVGSNQWIGVELQRLGLGAVLVEYRGYGRSVGYPPNELGLYADASAVMDRLHDSGISKARTVLWGFSLGTGVAAEMASRGYADRLVLQAPFTSVPDVAARVAPFLPVRWLLKQHFDTFSKADHITVPTLVIHGDADPVVPFDMGQTIARAIPGARFVRVPDGGHEYDYGKGRWIFEQIAEFVQG